MDEANSQCLVCYEPFGGGDVVILEDCKHQFCSPCIFGMCFRKTFLCPIDNREVKSVVHLGRSKPIFQYQYDLWIMNQQTMQNDVENYWANYLSMLIDIAQRYRNILFETHKVLRYWIKDNSKVSSSSINDLNNYNNENFALSRNYFTVVPIKPPSLELLKWLFDKFENPNPSLFQRNVISKEIEVCVDLYYLSSKLTTNLKHNDKNFLETLVASEDKVKRHREGLETIYRYLTVVTILYLRDNREVYELLQPRFDPRDISKCLVCSEVVDQRLFLRFPECCHKICWCCYDKFRITHGSCPFHVNELHNLLLSDAGKLKDVKNEPDWKCDPSKYNHRRIFQF